MFLFFENLPDQLQPQAVADAGHHVWSLIQGQDLMQKSMEELAGWLAVLGATQLKKRLDDRDRHKHRVQLVTEAASVLRLRDQLSRIQESSSEWAVVKRLSPHLDSFAQQNLAKVEQQFLALRAGARILHKPSLLERVLLLYSPRESWVWIIHALFYAALGSALTTIVNVMNHVRTDHTSVWTALYGARMSFLGILLSASFFSILGNYRDTHGQASADGGSRCDPGTFTRPLWVRALLLFAPCRRSMWVGHIVFFGYVWLALRFLPMMFKDASVSDGMGYAILILLFVVPPAITFNLVSNWGDLQSQYEDSRMQLKNGVPEARSLHRNIVRRLFLLYLPRKWWLIPVHLAFYPLCSITLVLIAAAIGGLGSPEDAEGWLMLAFFFMLPTALTGLFANLADAICGILKQRRLVAAQAAAAGQRVG